MHKGKPATNGSTYTVPTIINGEEQILSRTFDVINPSTLEISYQCSSADVLEAEQSAAAAAAAFPLWSSVSANERRKIFIKAAEVMERRRSELVGYMLQETGDDESWCHFNIDVAIDCIRDVGGRAVTLCGAIHQTQDPKVTGLVLKEPYGVVLSIAPWNAPYILGTRAIAFPLGAGNTVVLKGTELAPRTMWGLVSVFQEAGLPNGALNLISTEPALAPDVTKALISSPHIKKINFTGSTMVGRIIGKLASDYLKPVVQELGGKAPAIVWEDADLDLAAKQCALGSFINSGQVCMCTERIIVHKSVASEFKKRLIENVDTIFGAKEGGLVLINEGAVQKNKHLVQDAVKKGAVTLYGDAEVQEGSITRMRPIILEKITPDMAIYYSESFGPSVSLFEVSDEAEALKLANDTEYGLTAAVFTRDLQRGLEFAQRIESGAVHINSMTIHDESALPHGGAKASGHGRFNASYGLEEWVRTKTVTFPRSKL